MFDVIRNNKRIVQVFLLLLAVPFAFFGVDFLRSGGRAPHIAKVGESNILLTDFQDAIREQQRSTKSPEVNEDAILRNLVAYQLLAEEINQRRLFVADDTLRNILARFPYFKEENGEFSESLYKSLLAKQNLTPERFEADLRQKTQFQYLVNTLQESAFVSQATATRVLDLLAEVREVQEFLIPAQDFVGKVMLEADEARKFYDENIDRFNLPEAVRVEYVVLEKIPEERRASHILLEAREGTDRTEVRKKAEEVLREVKKAPGRFAELAKKYSQDESSAVKGGDLDFFVRESMVKSFGDAVFSMQEGELSDLVETEYGFHIIKLTGIKPGRFSDRNFIEMEEEFADLVFNEHPDSLKPVAEKYATPLYQSGWLPRKPEGGMAYGVFDNPELREAIFSEDVIKNGHNSKAIQIAPNVLVSARLLEYQPAALQPFEDAQADIETHLKFQHAVTLAAKEGEARLSELGKNPKDEDTTRAAQPKKPIRWGEKQEVSRLVPGKVENMEALTALFKADVKTLPAYVGVEIPELGYAVYRINKTTIAPMDEAEKLSFARQDLPRLSGNAQLFAYVNALRQRLKVEVNTAALEKIQEKKE
jgi:peptidyl-prolyl cis-trans isomerase D